MQNQPKQLDDTKAVIVAQILDRKIYDFIRTSFTNRSLLLGISIQEQVNAYQQYGQHQIDFTKIYDLE